MNRNLLLLLFFLLTGVFQGCNTLYNTKVIEIQVLVPGTARIPKDYTKLAVKYNNSNIAFNPTFASYFEDTTHFSDTRNLDSIASLIYFDVFTDFVSEQNYFEAVTVLEPTDFGKIAVSDSLVLNRLAMTASDSVKTRKMNPEILKITRLAGSIKPAVSKKDSTLFIDPDYGFYTRNDLDEIARQTGADIFLSFDFFATANGIYSPDYYLSYPDSLKRDYLFEMNKHTAEEVVYVFSVWNIYDLKRKELTFAWQDIDTVNWVEPAYSLREAKRVLPPRKDAVLNAADIAGTQFARYISPYWVKVERMYYQSGHVDLKKTDKMVADNRWLEAAEIWRANVKNKNRNIAAKSMFNLALACEMNGEIDAAIDWAVKSYYVFGSKKEDHASNTEQYIRILGQRKLDIRKLENKMPQ